MEQGQKNKMKSFAQLAFAAALLITELASELKEQGRTLLDLLDDLAVEHGLHATDQLSVRVEDLSVIADAMRRSLRWAARCQAAATRADQAQFGIVQGGLDAELRAESAEGLVKLDFRGYAIGGLSVGETPAEMYAALDLTTPLLPRDKPRYLMGVGRPEDLVEGVNAVLARAKREGERS